MPDKPLSRADALKQLTAPGQPFAMQLVDIGGNPCRVYVNAPNSLRELFAENRSDETFFVYEDERYSFEDMYQRAATIAATLVNDYGVGRGDRIAIAMRNYPEWIMAFTAITSIGAIAVAMNALWGPEEMAYGLSHSGARLVFADQERVDRLARCEPSLNIDIIGVRLKEPVASGVRLISDILATPAAMPTAEIDPDEDTLILYTSGSTGHPKGAVSSHRAVISALLSWEIDAAASALINNTEPLVLPYQIATLLGVPLFHVAGSHAVYLSCYRSQRKLVGMYKWDVETAAELIEREQIASFVAPAAMTGDLVEAALRTQRDLSSLLVVGGGGAPRAPDQVKRIATTFKQAIPNTGWGMTETNAIGTGISGQDYLDRPSSSGRVAAVLDVAIMDEAGNHLPQGQRGELMVRGTSMIRGYWDNPAANASSFTDGWFHTGDVAYLDEEDFVFIVDRLKQLIIRGGENIGCGEVEAALLNHPDVIEASVYGVPDERLGEEIGATVYVRQAVDEEALRGFLVDHLARFKIPRYISSTFAVLPRIASGKIDKIELRAKHGKALGL
ncbi:MAG: acyl--CoA ligase [SAR86 cluster bacterium]|uniref:Acyl--CoA ligase n=1 Tax=SAR86 cluster bacterium TaxID=2030880 RepID=A0A972W0K5_9GAMM|nr:acyl--CoA ligase [SAR86 cluster bacterium]